MHCCGTVSYQLSCSTNKPNPRFELLLISSSTSVSLYEKCHSDLAASGSLLTLDMCTLVLADPLSFPLSQNNRPQDCLHPQVAAEVTQPSQHASQDTPSGHIPKQIMKYSCITRHRRDAGGNNLAHKMKKTTAAELAGCHLCPQGEQDSSTDLEHLG